MEAWLSSDCPCEMKMVSAFHKEATWYLCLGMLRIWKSGAYQTAFQSERAAMGLVAHGGSGDHVDAGCPDSNRSPGTNEGFSISIITSPENLPLLPFIWNYFSHSGRLFALSLPRKKPLPNWSVTLSPPHWATPRYAGLMPKDLKVVFVALLVKTWVRDSSAAYASMEENKAGENRVCNSSDYIRLHLEPAVAPYCLSKMTQPGNKDLHEGHILPTIPLITGQHSD